MSSLKHKNIITYNWYGIRGLFFSLLERKIFFNEGPALQMGNMSMSANSLYDASRQCHFVIAKGL